MKMSFYLIAGVAALGGLLFGYDTGVISGALLFIRDAMSLSATMQGIVVAIVLAGAVIGSAAAGSLSDRFGRRPVILCAGLLFIAGALFSAVALRMLRGRVRSQGVTFHPGGPAYPLSLRPFEITVAISWRLVERRLGMWHEIAQHMARSH
jgi:MFS family permease